MVPYKQWYSNYLYLIPMGPRIAKKHVPIKIYGYVLCPNNQQSTLAVKETHTQVIWAERTS